MIHVCCIFLLTGVDDSDIVTVSPDESECLNKLISWQLEAAWICRYYFEHRICKTLLESAQAHCGVNIQLDGKLNVPASTTLLYMSKIVAILHSSCLVYMIDMLQIAVSLLHV